MFTPFNSEKVKVLADALLNLFQKVKPHLPRILLAAAVGLALGVAFNLGRAQGQKDIVDSHPVQQIMFSRNARSAELNMCAFDKPERLLICATVEEMMQTEGDL